MAWNFSSESFLQAVTSFLHSGKTQLNEKWPNTKRNVSFWSLGGGLLLLYQPSCLQAGISRLFAVVSAVFLIWERVRLGRESVYVTQRSLIHPDYVR